MARSDWHSVKNEYNWFDAADWSNGVPGASDEADFRISQPYQVDVNSSIDVQAIKFFSPAVLAEGASAAITADIVELGKGVMQLPNANDIDTFSFNGGGGVAYVGNDHSLGIHPIDIDTGVIISTDDVNIHNTLKFSGNSSLGASGASDVLKISGQLSAHNQTGTGNAPLISFLGGDGTVIVTSTSFTNDAGTYSAQLGHGTVKSGTGVHATGANELFSGAARVDLAQGILDVRNFGTDVTLHNFSGDITGELLGNSGVTVHVTDPSFGGVLSGVTMDLGGTGHFGGHLGHTIFTLAAGTNVIDYSTALDGNIQISGPSGSTSTITVGEHTTEHFTDFQDGNITLDVAVASTAHVTYIEDVGDIRMVVHPGHGDKAFSFYFDGVTSSDDLALGNDGHGHLRVTWGSAAEAPAHLVTSHDPWAAHDFI